MTAYLRPRTVEEATAARAEHLDYTVLAGGTDLLVAANTRPEPVGIIDVFGLPGLCGLEHGEGGALRIGAATTYSELLQSEICRHQLPALWASAREVGALQIQARGTIGGNIATSSPVGDTLPVWLALDASIELVSTRGRRVVAYDEYCTGYRETAMKGDELISAVLLPPRPAGLRQFWRKMGTRRAQSISKVMVAGAATTSDGVISHVRIALGAVADRPIRARAAEAAASGQTPADAAAAVRAALSSEIVPIDDVRSTASYRLVVAENVVARFIRSLGASSAA